MSATYPAPSTAAGSKLPPASLRAWWRRQSPLARQVATVLAIKLAGLWLLWFACFRAPVAPHMILPPQQVESRLLGAAPSPEATHAVP